MPPLVLIQPHGHLPDFHNKELLEAREKIKTRSEDGKEMLLLKLQRTFQLRQQLELHHMMPTDK